MAIIRQPPMASPGHPLKAGHLEFFFCLSSPLADLPKDTRFARGNDKQKGLFEELWGRKSVGGLVGWWVGGLVGLLVSIKS